MLIEPQMWRSINACFRLIVEIDAMAIALTFTLLLKHSFASRKVKNVRSSGSGKRPVIALCMKST